VGTRRQGHRFAIRDGKQEALMDKDRVEGVGHQIKGSIKEGVGHLTGDKKTEAEGAAEKTAGKVQNTVGGAKDSVRDAANKI
jgi:uncharacterized protein YjbJ (UPF0337 family)